MLIAILHKKKRRSPDTGREFIDSTTICTGYIFIIIIIICCCHYKSPYCLIGFNAYTLCSIFQDDVPIDKTRISTCTGSATFRRKLRFDLSQGSADTFFIDIFAYGIRGIPTQDNSSIRRRLHRRVENIFRISRTGAALKPTS